MEPSSAFSKRPRVLVVGPDGAGRGHACQALEAAGLEALAEEVGPGVAGCIAEVGPELLVLLAEAPDAPAFELCHELRRRVSTSELPILLVVPREPTTLIERAHEVGATDFVTAPLDARLFAHRVLFLLRAGRTLGRLRESQERLARAHRLARLGYWDWDVEQSALTVSEELVELLGDPGLLTDPTLERLIRCVHPQDRDVIRRCFDEARSRAQASEVEHRVLLPDGKERVMRLQIEVAYGEHGHPARISGTLQDVTERRRDQEKIQRLAYYDVLTGLPNRRFLLERMPAALEHAFDRGRLAALLLIDLDRFSRINESFGHSVGDELLKDAAQRILTRLRMSDHVMRAHVSNTNVRVSRVAGDQFVLLVSHLPDAQLAARIARRLLDCFRRPFQVPEREVFLTASVGIAIHPVDGRDVEALLRNADAALQHAKRAGGNQVQFYAESMNAKAARRVDLENRLRRAVERGELSLHFQPKVELRTRRLAGLEALLRWQHPELGWISPAEFIPIAEEGDLIIGIGEWVLQAVSEQLRRWRAEGLRTVPVAVNLSRREIGDPALLARVQRILREGGLAPDEIEFEVTESAIMQDEEAAVRNLKALRDQGFTLALDDFGTGYSSLTYLRRFPVDALKIDRSFVCNVASDPDDAAIVAATIAMARNLKLTVVAEGVETDEQEVFLYGTGCDQLQGYRIGPPLPGRDCVGFLPPASKPDVTRG